MRSLLTRAASLTWSTLSSASRAAYTRGLLKSHQAPSRVVSVGNIQAGGAGKTPLVACIAREAHARSLSVCILTRGYKGAWAAKGGIIAPKAVSTAFPKAAESGDEALLLHDLAPNSWIGVGADRLRQFNEVSKHVKIDLVVLDDGFQNHTLKKDLEIVAVTSAKPAEMLFRDLHSALGHADLVVWSKGEHRPNSCGKPLVKIGCVIPATTERKSVLLVTGIADPSHARKTIEGAGYFVTNHIAFSDHEPYSLDELRRLEEKARHAGCALATTGKDWVKWRELGVNKNDVLVFEPELKFLEGRDIWNRVLWEE